MKNLSLEERQVLEDLLQKQQSKRAIARLLRRSHSTILDELKRNKGSTSKYTAILAHKKSLRRKNERHKRSKIEISPGLKQYIINKLMRYQWSPEQMSRFLRIKSGGRSVISHESIYLFIYSEEGKKLGLYKHLRRKKKPERQCFGSRKKRVLVFDRTSIHRRHKSINERSAFGHWETDLMIFSKQKFVLAVSVERLSRYTIVSVLPNKTALGMKQALYRVILDFGQTKVKSITFDNGSENVLHHELKYEFPGLETFFCDPFCSWQKGTVENTNGLLRQYFPRHIDLSSFSQEYIDSIVQRLNNRPRKCLNFLSPNFLFNAF